MSRESGHFGRLEPVAGSSANPSAVALFSRGRRPAPSLPFPAFWCLASGVTQRLLMSIAGSSSDDA